MISPAEARRKAHSGGRIAVVRRHAHTIQETWKKRQVLLPGHLDTGKVCAGSVDRLSHLVPGKLPARWQRADGKNGVAQGFVEPAGLDYADRFQILLKQEIEIIGMCGLEVRIARPDLGNPADAGRIDGRKGR